MTAPISYHLDLYRYWDAKRGGGLMPTRRDIDPTEIPRLLPSIALVDRKDQAYRWRLMGSRVVSDFGSDLTGQSFGEYVVPDRFVNAMTATFDRVLRSWVPVFEETLYTTALRATHAVSRLLLPLGASGSAPEMILMTRITRRVPVEHEPKFLKGASGQICATFDIASAGDLASRVSGWEDGSRPSLVKICPQPNLCVAGIWSGGFPQIVQAGSAKAALVPVR
jgi:hypothetical protein